MRRRVAVFALCRQHWCVASVRLRQASCYKTSASNSRKGTFVLDGVGRVCRCYDRDSSLQAQKLQMVDDRLGCNPVCIPLCIACIPCIERQIQ